MPAGGLMTVQGGGGGDGEATGTAFTPAEWRLGALSPLDGRYGRQMEPYAAVFSEAALIRERFAVEVAWLVHLSGWPGMAELGPLSEADHTALRHWAASFA